MSAKKKIEGYHHVPFQKTVCPPEQSLIRSKEYLDLLDARRTVRDISEQNVDKAIITNLIKTASTAPSGANKQPWTFCAVSNPNIKKHIREAAEQEEHESYQTRMSDRWKEALKPMNTNWEKPFLTQAPWLIVVFKEIYEFSDNVKSNNYYVNESVGIACGLLISAIHQAGLVTVPHTPSPMNFLSTILQRPSNERPFLLMPVGYPNKGAFVPDLKRKSIDRISVFFE